MREKKKRKKGEVPGEKMLSSLHPRELLSLTSSATVCEDAKSFRFGRGFGWHGEALRVFYVAP
jgi:hypothetical protein